MKTLRLFSIAVLSIGLLTTCTKDNPISLPQGDFALVSSDGTSPVIRVLVEGDDMKEYAIFGTIQDALMCEGKINETYLHSRINTERGLQVDISSVGERQMQNVASKHYIFENADKLSEVIVEKEKVFLQDVTVSGEFLYSEDGKIIWGNTLTGDIDVTDFLNAGFYLPPQNGHEIGLAILCRAYCLGDSGEKIYIVGNDDSCEMIYKKFRFQNNILTLSVDETFTLEDGSPAFLEILFNPSVEDWEQ